VDSFTGISGQFFGFSQSKIEVKSTSESPSCLTLSVAVCFSCSYVFVEQPFVGEVFEADTSPWLTRLTETTADVSGISPDP
jgi:hypothetical protein